MPQELKMNEFELKEMVQQYAMLSQAGHEVEALETQQEYKNQYGWGLEEESVLAAALFNIRQQNYQEERLAEAYVALCQSGQVEVAESLAAWAGERVFCGPADYGEFQSAVERLERVN